MYSIFHNFQFPRGDILEKAAEKGCQSQLDVLNYMINKIFFAIIAKEAVMTKVVRKAFSLETPPTDYSERLANFHIDCPEYFNFADDVVDAWAERDRNKLAMIWTDQHGHERKYTFNDFRRLSNQAANLLLKHGVIKGDRVIMMLPRLPEWWIFSLALIRLGAVQCHVPTLLTAADLKQRIQFGKFKMIIADETNADKVEAVCDDCPSLSDKVLVDGTREGWINYTTEIVYPVRLSATEVKTPYKHATKATDPLLLVFTSGTSKYPKLVEHSCAYPLAHRITAEIWHGLNSNDLHYTASDTGWAKNLWGNYFGQWLVGACVFIFDIRGKFDPDQVLPMLEKYGITSFCAPPTIYRMLVLLDLRKFDLSALRQCTSAGESLHTETIRLWKEGTGITIREGYGQTETVCMICNPAGFAPRPGAMGKASPGWEIELHDEDGHAVPEGEDGRIAVKVVPERPVGLFDGYLFAKDDNQQCFVGDYYYTGDKARRDEDGYFWFIGRSDDIIKSSGYRIGPLEVEEALMQHAAVREVAVVGAPDPLRGAKVKAYIVLHDGWDATESLVRELQQHCKRITAPYKYPREIEFVSNLPKTFSGKIKRDILRRHAENGEGSWE